MSWHDLFPDTARVNGRDHLEIGGCDMVELAREHGTPLYVFDESTVHAQALQARAAFNARWRDALVLYASKAYFSPFLARLYRDLGLGLDVTSAAEIEIARRAAFPPDRIYLHGNNKTPAEIRAALVANITHLVVDSHDELALIAALARELNSSPRLLLRLSPDIDPHTHRHLTTGVADSKFGLAIANGAATRAVQALRRYPQLQLVGAHVHIGSQIFEAEAIANAVKSVLEIAADWRVRFGFELQELDVGGGWGVAYTEAQTTLAVETSAEVICATLREGLDARGLAREVKLLVEPGRGLIARAAVALYRVGAIKTIAGVRTYAAVDGGMGDNIRPALYGAPYSARVANKFNAPATDEYAIAGRYCEQGDVLIQAVQLPQLETDDLLVIPVAGAYHLPMASNYNLIPRPAVVLVNHGRARLLRRRETIDDLLACEIE